MVLLIKKIENIIIVKIINNFKNFQKYCIEIALNILTFKILYTQHAIFNTLYQGF